jgi:RNA-directed DNA polymerase
MERSGIAEPSPVRRVEIEKPDGGIRQLGIPTVIDRVFQQAIAQFLTPIFDPEFSTNSFGFRPYRNGQQAIKSVQSLIKEGRRFAVDARVNHDLLMTRLGRQVNGQASVEID